MYISVLVHYNYIFPLCFDMLFHFNKPCITVEVVILWSVKEMSPVPGDIHINLSLLIQSTKKVL